MFPRQLSAGFVGVPRCQKTDTCRSRFLCSPCEQNSGMIHSFWECFAEERKLLLQIPIVNGWCDEYTTKLASAPRRDCPT